MHPDIEKHWLKLQEAKKAYLEKLSEIPSELLHTQPVDSWSAIQVTEHLLFSETDDNGFSGMLPFLDIGQSGMP